MTPQDTMLSLDDLLVIDVDSELRKLTSARLHGSWQIPAELARRQFRAGATRVELRFHGKDLTVVDNGPPMDTAIAHHAATLMDTTAPLAARHRSLVALEQADETALIALAGAPGARMHFSGGIRISAAGIDQTHARTWLQQTGRFVFLGGRELIVDGKTYRGEFGRPILQAMLPDGQGWMALQGQGSSGRLWLLQHGMVSAHFSTTTAPFFDAAIETGDAASVLDGERLRALGSARLNALETEVSRILATHLSTAAAHARRPISIAMLQDVRRHPDRPDARHAPLFLAYQRDPGTGALRTTHISLERMQQTGGRNTMRPVLQALSPRDRPGRFAIGDTEIPVLDETERSLLSDILGVTFVQPPLRASANPASLLLRHLATTLVQAATTFRNMAARLLLRRRAVAHDELSTSERALLAALAATTRTRPEKLQVTQGSGTIAVTGMPRRLEGSLPRFNPTVAAAVQHHSRNPRWLYPILVALGQGRLRRNTSIRAARRDWHHSDFQGPR